MLLYDLIAPDKISIHALRKERDRSIPVFNLSNVISIHALRKERDADGRCSGD